MKQRKVWLLVLLMVVIALVVRLPGLGDFMTVDEEQWMLRSGVFWHELFRLADPSGTFLTTHPGAPAMWLTGAGIFWQEARQGFDVDTSNLQHFRLAATLPIAVVTSLLIGLAVWMLAYLKDWRVAGLAGLVLAVDPYLTGMSQIAHLDALLALFMLGSVLAFFACRRKGRLWLLVLSGVLAGLAMATKFLPSLWLWLFFGLVVFARDWCHIGVSLRRVVQVLGFLFGVAALTFYITWPVLWVSDDFMRSFNQDVPAVITQEHVALEASEDPIEPSSFYVRTLLGRSTPFVLLVTLGVLLAGIRSWKENKKMPLVMWFFVYLVGFLVLITLAAKKADRYALPTLVVLSMIAGWGLGIVLDVLKRWAAGPVAAGALPGLRPQSHFVLNVPDLKSSRRATRYGRSRCSLCGTVAALLVIILLVAQVVLLSPYAIAYNNPYLPNIRPLSQQGWGEGLDEAARWLNEHPLADKLVVASWYPGVTRAYFDGKTMSLSSRDDERVGYVVTYRNMAGRAPDDVASNVLDEYGRREPVHTVTIGGQPYVRIYEIMGLYYFPRHVGELTGDMEVGQEVTISKDGWSAIEIGMANFSGRRNSKDVILHVREDVNSEIDLRTVRVNAAQIEDSSWHRFEFEPVVDSAGQTYYVALTSPESVKGDAVTVRFVEEDVLPGQMLLRRRRIREGEENSDFRRSGDMAYRLP